MSRLEIEQKVVDTTIILKGEIFTNLQVIKSIKSFIIKGLEI